MRSAGLRQVWTLALAGLLALATQVVGLPGVALAQPTIDETPLTPEQDAAIRDEMSVLYSVLLQGGKAPQEAKLAVNAVGLCLGAAYMHRLTKDQASAVCGEVLDAFTIQPGTVLYQLTPDDRAWIQSRVTSWTSELSALLEPEEVDAVRSTMQACLEGYMRRGEDREGAVKRCALGVLPLLDKPGLREFVVNAAASR